MINQSYKLLILIVISGLLTLLLLIFLRSYDSKKKDEIKKEEEKWIPIPQHGEWLLNCEEFEKYSQIALEEGDGSLYMDITPYTNDPKLSSRQFIFAIAMAAKHGKEQAYWDIFEAIDNFGLSLMIDYWIEYIDSCSHVNCNNSENAEKNEVWLDSINRDKILDYLLKLFNSDRSKTICGDTLGERIDKWYKNDDAQKLIVRDTKTGQFMIRKGSGKQREQNE